MGHALILGYLISIAIQPASAMAQKVEASDGKTYEVEASEEPANLDFFTKFGPIILEETKLKDLHTILGPVSLKKIGDAGTFTASGCVVDGEGRVVNFSSSEFHGGEVIGKIEAFERSQKRARATSCRSISKPVMMFSPKNHIWLGASRGKVEKKMGKPGYFKNDFSIYVFDRILMRKSHCGKESKLAESTSFEFTFKKNVVVAIVATKFSEWVGENLCPN